MIGSIVSALPSSNLGAGARAFWRATEAAEVAFAGEMGEATVDDHGLEAWREWQRRWTANSIPSSYVVLASAPGARIDDVGGENANDLRVRSGRIGQRAENVEDGASADLFAGGGSMAGGGMSGGRE